MIISHRKKFAFFANPKTASKAAGLMLRLSCMFDENDIMMAQPFLGTRTARIELPEYNLNGHKSFVVNHMTPPEAIEAGFITLEQMREYDCYAFLRDPEERFLASRIAMQINRYGKIAPPGRRAGGAAPPQHDYFHVGDEQVVTPLDFDNYEEELRAIIKKHGGIEHMDVAQVRKSFRAELVNNVHYNPRQHTEDTAFYDKVMQGK